MNLSPTIQTLRGRIPEAGKIKIGGKGSKELTAKSGRKYKPPVKFNYIAITTLERGEDGNFKRDKQAIELFGEKPQKIPVVLLFDDPAMNFPSCFMAFKGSKKFCVGDGINAIRDNHEINCPCERSDPTYDGDEICKWHGVLSCIIPGLSIVGGVYKFRTTSKHGVEAITSGLNFIHDMTDGKLRGIPLALVLQSTESINPKTGDKVPIKYCRIEFAGSIPELIDKGDEIYNKNTDRRQHRLEIEVGMKQLAIAEVLPTENDTDEDISDEYHQNTDDITDNNGNEIPSIDISAGTVDTSTGEVTEPETETTATPDEPDDPEPPPIKDLFGRGKR